MKLMKLSLEITTTKLLSLQRGELEREKRKRGRGGRGSRRGRRGRGGRERKKRGTDEARDRKKERKLGKTVER